MALTHLLTPPNNNKQNGRRFCRSTSAIYPGIHARVAPGQRQNDRIMSPKTGTPAATTICNCEPTNDLRPTMPRGPKQNAINPEPQMQLFQSVGEPHDNMHSPAHPRPLTPD